jgi:T-complex protein 1 subunit beta
MIIVKAWRMARKVALETLRKAAKVNEKDDESFREDLLKIARTTISSKLLKYEKEHFA